nr:PREDICTED: lactosylceramide 1,3-N-acetyl-beta-D-glucosaminyltransferase isoform X2 [Megachile rotundata]
MGIKVIFVIFSISMTIILFFTVLKTDFASNTEKELKTLYNASLAEKYISLISKFVIEPICSSNFIIWIVTSSANNPLQRTAVRRAYPNEMLKSLGIRRVFLLGIPKEENMWKYIFKESQIYNDLLQGSFLEDYRNLTLKHLMGLRWASKNCKATFLIKTDDDIVLNMFEVLRVLHKKEVNKNAISGYVLRKMKPVRTLNSKWFVTKEDFSGDTYPDFLSDDVYITGILRQECDITVEELNNFYATDYRYLECCIQGRKKKLKCEFMAGPDGGKKELHIKFREFSEFCESNCSERMKEQLVSRTCVAAYEEKINVEDFKVQVNYI